MDNFIVCFVTEICFNFILKKSLAWIGGGSEGKNLSVLKHLLLLMIEDLILRQRRLNASVLTFSVVSKSCCLLTLYVLFNILLVRAFLCEEQKRLWLSYLDELMI